MRLRDWRQRRADNASLVQAGAVTLNLPHQRTPDLVEAVLPLWESQTVRPIIDLIDCDQLPKRSWRHPSERIAVACEITQLSAGTEFVLFAHVDVFPRRRDLVEWLRSQCSADCPVVGYEISPRDMHRGRMATEWQGMVGHSLTMIHTPTIRAAGITWAYDLAFTEFGWSASDHWDTEVTFNLCIRAAGLAVKIVGHDLNLTHLVDEWHGHARSYPGAKISGHDHQHVARTWVDEEIVAARKRVQEWNSGGSR